ncbi:MAG: PQQ-binding-like beta-propeller repeat protein [Bacteroidales bacterium]|nr:PQQ-binding-like beta-propeller repeat protein [Bacteroidales bacterium]
MDRQTQLKLSANTAIVSGIFSILVSILLLISYWQTSSFNPLETEAIQALVERLAEDPGNDALRDEIRTLDLLARKAYFTSTWQVKTGGYLLLFGAIVCIVALRYYYSLLTKIEKPGEPVVNENVNRILSQKWILAAGMVIMVLALAAAVLSRNHFSTYTPVSSAIVAEAVTGTDQVEVVEIRTDSAQEGMQGDEQEGLEGEVSQGAAAITMRFPTREEVLQHHNAFRGPFSNGITSRRNIPVDWDAATNRNIKWKVPVPKEGNNSPVLWGNKLFFAGAEGRSQTVYCYDHNTGRLLWQQDVNNIPGSTAAVPRVTDDTGLSAPTLTTDGQRVYSIFATGDVICFDMDGNRIWARNLGVPENHYGHASSLICWQDKLYVQYDTGEGGRLIALNVLTGETLWQTFREVEISWASPILAQIGGAYQVILVADPLVAGYDANTGKEMWSVPCMSGEVGPSAAYSDGLVYAVNEYAVLVAIDPTREEVVWEDNEFLSDISSPVVSNGLLFILTSYGIMVCYDAKTGEEYWEYQARQGFMSSPIVAENKLYVTDWDGNTYIFEVSREMNLIGECSLGEPVYTTPAFADGAIYFKGWENLYCIGQ